MLAFKGIDPALTFKHHANCVESLVIRAPLRGRGSAQSAGLSKELNDHHLGVLIDHIGCSSFFEQLRAWFKRSYHVDHIGLFQLNESSISAIAGISSEGGGLAAERVNRYTTSGLWQFDPSIQHIRQGLKAQGQQHVRVNLNGLSKIFRETLYKGLGDKIVLSGVRKSAAYSLSLFRDDSRDPFERDSIEGLMHLSEHLISVVAKHCEVRKSRADYALQASVEEIYACIQKDDRLTTRELEVCARIIHGMSCIGIALDLKVGEETVKTYKNRAYQKLGIGSQRELLTWYLSLWNPFDPSTGIL